MIKAAKTFDRGHWFKFLNYPGKSEFFSMQTKSPGSNEYDCSCLKRCTSVQLTQHRHTIMCCCWSECGRCEVPQLSSHSDLPVFQCFTVQWKSEWKRSPDNKRQCFSESRKSNLWWCVSKQHCFKCPTYLKAYVQATYINSLSRKLVSRPLPSPKLSSVIQEPSTRLRCFYLENAQTMWWLPGLV